MLLQYHLTSIQFLLSFIFIQSTCQAQLDQQQWHQQFSSSSVSSMTPSYSVYTHSFTYLGNTPYQNQSSSSSPMANDQIATALRVQRDIAVNVTVDQLVQPAIDLSTAFFGQNFTNSKINQVDTLLLMGYKRLVVDLYWDPLMSDWQVCPFFMNLTSSLSSSMNEIKNSKDHSLPSAASDMAFTVTTTGNRDTDILVQKDGYVCNYQRSKFRDFLESIDNYLYSTEEGRASQKTDIISIIMNLHEYADANIRVSDNDTITIAAAAGAIADIRHNNTNSNITNTRNSNDATNAFSRATIASPLLSEAVVPIADSHLSQIISASLSLSSTQSSRVYTPKNLTADREQMQALHNKMETSFWWPEWLNLIDRKVQIIFGFGTFDPPVSRTFKLTSFDNDMIFSASSINGLMNTTTAATDVACSPTLSSPVNSNVSWAFVSDRIRPFTYFSANNATQCGYSPYFTHANYSDSASSIHNVDDTGHLSDNVLSTIWSWDINEPAVTPGQGNNMYHNNQKRCAAIVKSTGRWRSMDCNGYYRVACKRMDAPYDWLVTNDTVTYDYALSPDICPQHYTFDVPRLPRDNTALRFALSKMENKLKEDDKVWINLNLVYTADDSCWVIGRYGNCWWLQETGQRFPGLVTTSIVSGLIILILVGFFVWVKCARLIRNRHSKSRKAMVKKMLAKREYVTVPA
ncbi:hypothetical protein BDF20DRAFT_892713 [Mycotypha africana]|uniref:uncharacterized protein n=1 Tax=Mycotypha africana TaxID=64632 RepID=UPI00230016CC|nr:uncharacterized protein BDF20DRAFT_892713 [Mycotypha africana]KAI8968994.1 hypothetical protein BDF20DRAFT_892713 [Mycotypha africana]